MRITLGRKLGLTIAALILLYGLLLGLSAYRFAKEYTINEIQVNNQQTVSNVRDYYLQNLLTDMSRVVRYWSVHPSLTGSNGVHVNDYEKMFSEWKGYLTLNRNVSNVYFGSSRDGSLLSVLGDSRLPKDYDARNRPWYEGALKNPDRVFWSRPYIDAGTQGDMVLTVSKAVRQGNEISGVVGMDIKLKSFSRMLKGTFANQSGYMVVLDSAGEVYAHPDEQMLTHDLSDRSWVRHALSMGEGSGTFSESTHQYVYAFMSLPETSWKLVGVREVDFSAIITKLRSMTLYTAFMVVLVMMLGAVLSARFVLKPLQAMLETIRSVSQGKLDARCGVSSQDEIGEISEGFDRMLDRIAEMNAERDRNMKLLTAQNYEMHALFEANISMNKELEGTVYLIQDGYLSTVRSLANAIEANDFYTCGHCARVNEYALRLGRASGFSEKELQDLEFASILHDIGKIGIPDGIINKPGRLTEDEFKQIRQHPVIGSDILEGVTFLDSCRCILLQHHERMDGKGYPDGLSGEAIHPAARILAIADSYDAMTSIRPYRLEPMLHDEAIKELERGRGTQFDGVLMDLFIRLMKNPEELMSEQDGYTVIQGVAV